MWKLLDTLSLLLFYRFHHGIVFVLQLVEFVFCLYFNDSTWLQIILKLFSRSIVFYFLFHFHMVWYVTYTYVYEISTYKILYILDEGAKKSSNGLALQVAGYRVKSFFVFSLKNWKKKFFFFFFYQRQWFRLEEIKSLFFPQRAAHTHRPIYL